MKKIALYLSSRNNYSLLENFLIRNQNHLKNYYLVNIDDFSEPQEREKGIKICNKYNIPFLSNRDRGLQNAAQTMIDYIGDKYSYILWLTHDTDFITENFIDKFDNDANAEKLLSLIDSQIPVSVIVDSLLLAGFSEGVFNPDIAILTAEDLTMLLMKIAEDAGIEYKVIPNQDSAIDEGLQKIAEFKKDKTDFQKATTQSPSERIETEMPEEEIEEQPMEQPQGLMARQEMV